MSPKPVLKVIVPGACTTVQDYGRPGWQRFGVPVAGALDRVGLSAANLVAGNAADSAAIECLYLGPTFQLLDASASLAVAGANVFLEIADPGSIWKRIVPAFQSVPVAPGAKLRVVMNPPAISAYLAVEGGIDVPLVMGSRATYIRARLGGLDGRRLSEGDLLPLREAGTATKLPSSLRGVRLQLPTTVRVVLGPQDDLFKPTAIETLTAEAFDVMPASDRMGLRLRGKRLEHVGAADIISDGVAAGSIQVPANGQPIVMLADRQTTGGYAKIATVISADLPGLGRIGPGAALRFKVVEVAEAEQARRALDAEIAGWSCQTAADGVTSDTLESLLDENLISGFIDALA